MSSGRAPRTDIGTVLLHGLFLAAFLLAAATGLRLAADDPDFAALRWLDFILPAHNLWRDHMAAAFVLVSLMVAYAVYMRAAALTRRISLGAGRIKCLCSTRLLRGDRIAVAALGVLMLWIFYLAMLALAVSGVMLFRGAGGFWLSLHLASAAFATLFPVAHVAGHLRIGGLNQITRIVRPTRALPQPPPDIVDILVDELDKVDRELARRRLPAQPASPAAANTVRNQSRVYSHPLASATAGGIAIFVLGTTIEGATRTVLVIPAIMEAQAPVLDGDLSEPVWAAARPVSVLTTQGANFGGAGESLVEIRAVHDREFVYFAFTWTDPTRSLKHLPLLKLNGRWYLAQEHSATADETAFFEDQFAVLLSRGSAWIVGAAIHLTAAGNGGLLAGRTGRGLHYTLDGSLADIWHWKAAQGGLTEGHTGVMDNAHIGPLQPATTAQAEGRDRYTGGLGSDRGTEPYGDNFSLSGPQSAATAVLPRRLPRDHTSARFAMGRIDPDADIGEAEGARWWLTQADSLPYSPEADASIPDGSVIPGVLLTDVPTLGRAEIRCAAKWAAGRWTLEVRRRLDTGRREDVPIRSGVLIWVAAFDHAQTRHTRHLRPIRLEVE